MQALERRTYRSIGQMISLFLMHDGPGPQCCNPGVVDYFLYGLSGMTARPDDIPNESIRKKVKKVHLINQLQNQHK